VGSNPTLSANFAPAKFLYFRFSIFGPAHAVSAQRSPWAQNENRKSKIENGRNRKSNIDNFWLQTP
jgi:hypothetical protein